MTSLLYLARFTAKAQTKDDSIGLAPIRRTRRNAVSSNGMMGLPDLRLPARRTRERQDLAQLGMRATSAANQVILRMVSDMSYALCFASLDSLGTYDRVSKWCHSR